MKKLALSMVVMLGSALTVAPGCGDDSDGGSTGGTSAGGSAGKGGSTSKGGSTAGGDTGDAGEANEGGTPGSGGTPGGGGTPDSGGAPAGGTTAGGAGSVDNPEGCPTDAPTDGDDCSVDLELQESCEYAGSRCYCNGYMPAAGGAGGAGGAAADTPGTWSCVGEGDSCPDSQPTNGDDCDNVTDLCPYPGDVSCTCTGAGWSCFDPNQGTGGAGNTPGECPTEEPENEAACDGPIPSCFYDDSNTLCSCPGFGPNADEWDCQSL